MPKPTPFGHIYVEMVVDFVTDCERKLDQSARTALFNLIGSSVVAESEKDPNDYAAHEAYYKKRWLHIAIHLRDATSNEHDVTAEHVIKAYQKEVQAVQTEVQTEKHRKFLATRICQQVDFGEIRSLSQSVAADARAFHERMHRGWHEGAE